MEPAIVPTRPTVSGHTVSCLWCHAIATHSDVMRHHGLCYACVHDIADISWRLVYDRDRNIGSIPSNLRVAYGL
jgi:hypothetical protein